MAYPYYAGSFFDFNGIMQQWINIGMFDVLLPMVLFFAVFYAILERTKILGGLKQIDAVVALVMSFFSIANPMVTAFLIPLFSNAAAGVAMILVFIIFSTLLMPRVPNIWRHITLWGGIVIFIWVMSRAASFFGDYFIFSSAWWLGNAWWLIPLILFLVMFGLVTGSEESDYEKQLKAAREYFPPTWNEWYTKPHKVDDMIKTLQATGFGPRPGQ